MMCFACSASNAVNQVNPLLSEDDVAYFSLKKMYLKNWL